MPWFRVDDSLDTHPKAIAAGNEAIGLWVRCGAWLARYPQQEEFIPRAVAERFGTTDAAERLVRAGLWQRAKRGYRMPASIPSVPGATPMPIWSAERDDYRRKIPQNIRDFVYQRDGYRCVICGSTEDLTLDHIHPWSRGGQDTQHNLQTMCRRCNSSKGAQI